MTVTTADHDTSAETFEARRNLLTIDSLVVSRVETDTEVAWIAHFMIGQDWIFEARAYGDGSIEFDQRDDDHDETPKGFGSRKDLEAHVRRMAEAAIRARYSDGRSFIVSKESWYNHGKMVDDVTFGLDGIAELRVEWKLVGPGIGQTAPCMIAFDDSFPNFTKLAEVFIDLGHFGSLVQNFTRRQFVAFLKSHGFEDRTEREEASSV
jgi:hypothetical protein